MRARLSDTIVAPITAMGPAAVTVLRASGPESWAVASGLFDNWAPEPAHARFGRFATGDEGFALPFSAAHSYTGEECVEFSIHGSPVSVRALIDAAEARGARVALPGEFTMRRFLNGRIDLTEAEAVKDTVEAVTERQFRAATLVRGGALRRAVGSLASETRALLAELEAHTDFPEELGDFAVETSCERLRMLIGEAESLIATASPGRILRQGARIAIVGAPNAGKSSLFNAVLGVQRAIVTPVAGTTRDYVEETVDMAGVKATLVDTAGLRETADPIESLGVQLARSNAESADLIWWVLDASRPEHSAKVPGERPIWAIWNKTDMAAPGTAPPNPRIVGSSLISAATGRGLGELCRDVASHFMQGLREDAAPIQRRHEAPLREAVSAWNGTLDTYLSGRPADLASVTLRLALSELGKITGETADEDMIDRIFADFCVGK